MLAGCALGSSLLLAGAPAAPFDPAKHRWSQVERRSFAGQPAGDLDYRERAAEPLRTRGNQGDRPSLALPSRPAGTTESLEETIRGLDAQLDGLAPPRRDPALLNDLALALLERGSSEARPLDLHRALRLLDEGLAAPHPGLPEPEFVPSRRALLFNRALCLERLQLPRAAAAQWRAYLEADPTSGWSLEAEERLSRLEEATRESRWHEIKVRLLADRVEAAEILQLAREFPLEIRQFAEEDLLGSWATEAAAPIPPQAGLIAQALIDVNQDYLLNDHLQRLRAAASTHQGSIVARAAQSRYIEAMDLHTREYRAEARTLFAETAEDFASIASPYANQARLYEAINISYQNATRVERQIGDLVARVDARLYPSLAGRSLWMAGHLSLSQGHLEKAIDYFERMRALLRRGDGAAQAAVSDTNLAAVYRIRGETTKSWNFLLLSMEATRHHTSPRRRYAPFFEAAKAAWRLDDLALTRLYLDEALALNQENTAWKAEALALRARVFERQGLREQAREDAHAALETFGALRDRHSNRGAETQVNLALAATLLREIPEDALRLLDASLRNNEEDGRQIDVIELLQMQAQAFRAQGNILQARNSLLRSVERIERMRNDAVQPQDKIKIFEQARSTVDQLVAWGLDDYSTTPELTLSDAELMRSIFVPDPKNKTTSKSKKRVNDEAAREEIILRAGKLPDSVVLIKFHVLEDRVATWVLRGGRIESPIVTEIRREELARRVRSFRSSLENGSKSEMRHLGGSLYELLLRPVETFLESKQLLGIVPDQALVSLPFAALYDHRKEAFLIEQFELTTLPTVLKGEFRENLRKVGALSALVMGAPDLDGTDSERMVRLPAAHQEAQVVANLYGGFLLSGPTATRDAFLSQVELYDVVHFAGHGGSMGPAIDDQVLFLAPDRPNGPSKVTGLDLIPLKLDKAHLVVLAACDTSGGFETSDPGRWGLAASLLLAGAQNVVTTFWDIEDSFSLSFMERFHQKVVDGETPTAALREVMLQEIDKNKDTDDFQWTAFSASGH